MMQNTKAYSEYKIDVDDEFSDVFSHFYFVQNNSDDSVKKTLFPSYCAILIFNFKAEVILEGKKLDKYLLLEPVKHAFDYSIGDGADVFVVNFKNNGFYRFFQIIQPGIISVLWRNLQAINNSQKRVDFFIDFCKPHIKRQNIIAEQISNFEPIKEIAWKNNKTQRAIQINYKKILGSSSKEIVRYERFLKAMELVQEALENALVVDWLSIAFELGYYDQSHLIRDFKHYLGLSPTKYVKNKENICISVI